MESGDAETILREWKERSLVSLALQEERNRFFLSLVNLASNNRKLDRSEFGAF